MPEKLVRTFLHKSGFRYRLHDKKLPGKPDIVLAKYKTAIFIHGCFWHGHTDCPYFVVPKTRTDWWLNKIITNQTKDEEAVSKLQTAGWKIITIWECELKKSFLDRTLIALKQQLR